MWDMDPDMVRLIGPALILLAVAMMLIGLLVFLVRFDRAQARKGADRQAGYIERRRDLMRQRWEDRRTGKT